jgi:hypothetical protein
MEKGDEERVVEESFAWWQDADVVFVSEDGGESRRVKEDRQVRVVVRNVRKQFVLFGT